MKLIINIVKIIFIKKFPPTTTIAVVSAAIIIFVAVAVIFMFHLIICLSFGKLERSSRFNLPYHVWLNIYLYHYAILKTSLHEYLTSYSVG
jgi:hypothetical protein